LPADEVGTMARKKVKNRAAKKKAVKKKAAKKKAPKKTPTKQRQRKTAKKKKARPGKSVETEPTKMSAETTSIKPFEVCNHFGVHLREIFEKEHSQNRQVQLGEVFEYLLGDLDGAWKMVKLYGKEMPIEKLRGKSSPFHYDL
jgi:hypothetical protein